MPWKPLSPLAGFHQDVLRGLALFASELRLVVKDDMLGFPLPFVHAEAWGGAAHRQSPE